MRLGERLRALVPTREQVRGNRWLGWLGPWLSDAKLWHWSRRGVALGVALGVFFGLLIPIAQIPLSVAAAVVLRANVPAAAASTLITNPVTFGPIYYFAYRFGSWVTGDSTPRRLPPAGTAIVDLKKIDSDASLWQRIAALGKPLLIGLTTVAVLMGLFTYGLITLVWRWHAMAKRRRRRKAAMKLPCSSATE